MQQIIEDRTLAHGTEEYLKLLNYVLEQPSGKLLRYTEVEYETGVRMDLKGKAKLRRAILRSKRECSTVQTVGYKLAEADMVMGILSVRLLRIDGAVKRADRAQRILQQQFFEALKPDEKRGVLYVGSIFGAIRLAAENGKRLYGVAKTPKSLTGTDAKIDIPNMP